jgi:hypothetical protein
MCASASMTGRSLVRALAELSRKEVICISKTIQLSGISFGASFDELVGSVLDSGSIVG